MDELGQRPQAQALYRELIAYYQKQLGADHPQTMRQQINLASSLLLEKRASEVLALLEPMLEVVQKRNLKVMESTVRRYIGRALVMQHRYPQAEEQLLAAYQLADTNKEARKRVQIVEYLVKLYEEWPKPDEAQRWRATTVPVDKNSEK